MLNASAGDVKSVRNKKQRGGKMGEERGKNSLKYHETV